MTGLLARLRAPLADRAQERIGQHVLAAVPFIVTNEAVGQVTRVLAVTDEDVYLLGGRHTSFGTFVHGVVERLPRTGLVVRWRPGPFRLRADLSWPRLAPMPVYLRGWTRPSPNAERLFGLLMVGAFEDARERSA